ncbi:MAG: TRAP transporter small permease [Thermodesulfobacteriota bacterium]|nr:TRAP transporter small permease [Thermodesulfobacteriota bacterium]
MKMMGKIEKGFDFFEKVLSLILRIFVGATVAIIFYSVVMRYVFQRPPFWVEELSRFIFIWIIMLGAVLVTREQSHIELVLFVNLLPKKWRFVLSIFTRLLMVVFCWVMVQQGIKIYPIVAEASSPTFGLSMGWLYLSIPVGGLLMGICILENIMKSLLRRGH